MPSGLTRTSVVSRAMRPGSHMRDACTRNGLVMRATRDTLFIAPPLVITRAEIDELLSKVVRSLDETSVWARAEGWI